MEVEILARVQFAFTIAFHYIYPPLSIGLGLIMVIMEGLYLKTNNKIYEKMARFWTRIFALTFGIGVATMFSGVPWQPKAFLPLPSKADSLVSFYLDGTG